MDLGLKGKNAAITGSSQGIGLAIATALAKEGCNVALSARGAQGLGIAVKEIEALGVRAVGVVADFASEEGCSKFVAEAASQLGGLDILVNNVGGLIPGVFEQLTAEQWDKILHLKLMAAVHTTKHALPYLKKAKGGRVLNVSGVTGRQLLPGSWTTALTNAGIISFSKLMAAHLGPGARRHRRADAAGALGGARRDRQRGRLPRLGEKQLHDRDHGRSMRRL